MPTRSTGQLTSTGDQAHRQALALSHSLQPNRIVTSGDVLDEYLAYFSGARPSIRNKAGATVAALLDDPLVHFVPQSHMMFLAGLELYRARPDKGYSLTDCISILIMRREGLTDILTNDRHFEQEGFRALFRSS